MITYFSNMTLARGYYFCGLMFTRHHSPERVYEFFNDTSWDIDYLLYVLLPLTIEQIGRIPLRSYFSKHINAKRHS